MYVRWSACESGVSRGMLLDLTAKELGARGR